MALLRPDPDFNQIKCIYGVNALSGNTVLVYAMYSTPNAKTSDDAWQIAKFTYDASDNILTKIYPRGANGYASSEFRFIADNYASYTYGAA